MNILFLSSWYPFPPDNGSKIRVYHLLSALARRHEVTLLSFVDDRTTLTAESAQSICKIGGLVPRVDFQPNRLRALLGYFSLTPRSLVDTYSPEMAMRIERELVQHHYDILVASELGSGAYFNRASGMIRICDDIELAIYKDRATKVSSTRSNLRTGLTWAKMQRYIRHLLRRFVACTVVSAQELKIIHEIAPAYSNIEVVPNGVDCQMLRMSDDRRLDNMLIFNGALTFGANYDAMRYFLAEIWPRIKAGQPAAKLQITGKTDTVNLNGLALDNQVELTGYLRETYPAVARAAACIVPLRIGSGTRLKILEAMALGTPVVATSKAAEGLEVKHGENILIADAPMEFAAQTLRVLRDPVLHARLALCGRRLVEEKYDWTAIGERFNHLLSAVAAGPSREGLA